MILYNINYFFNIFELCYEIVNFFINLLFADNQFISKRLNILTFATIFLISNITIAVSQSIPVTVRITADNAYVFGFGDQNEITDFRSPGVCNMEAAEIFSASKGVETYNITANLDGYIYIICWADSNTYQGVIAEFTDNINTIRTNPNLPNPNAQWEVFATGIELDPSTTDPEPVSPNFIPRTNNNCPKQIE